MLSFSVRSTVPPWNFPEAVIQRGQWDAKWNQQAEATLAPFHGGRGEPEAQWLSPLMSLWPHASLAMLQPCEGPLSEEVLKELPITSRAGSGALL